MLMAAHLEPLPQDLLALDKCKCNMSSTNDVRVDGKTLLININLMIF